MGKGEISLKRERLTELYIIRALAIIGVLLVHATALTTVKLDHSSKYYAFYNFVNIAFKYGTPTFILLSSFVLFYNYYYRPFTGKLIANFYKKRLMYIVVPYIIFTTIYYTWKLHTYYDFPEWNIYFQELFDHLIWATAHGHLYFVFISIQFYLLFPIILWMLKKWEKYAYHTIWIGFVLQWAFIIYNQYILQFEDKGILAISYVSYYMVGAYLGIYFEKIKDWLTVKKEHFRRYGLSWIALWSVWFSGMIFHVYIWYQTRTEAAIYDIKVYELAWNVHTITTAIVLFQLSFFLCRVLPRVLLNILIHLGVVSFGVYLLHPLVLMYYELHYKSSDPIVYHLLVAGEFLCILFIPWLIVGLFMKFVKGSWILFGAAPKKTPYIPKPSKE